MGKKLIDVLKNKDIGSIGIGAMIVFIAMVLVAGIAASVLIQTSTRLEMQALRTGQQTTDEVASGLKVEGIEGYNSSGKITKLSLELAARAGSPDIDLSEVVVEISDSSSKYVLTYPSSGTSRFTDNDDVNGSVFGCDFPSSSSDFYIIVLQDADDSISADNPIINFGDHVMLAVDTNTPFSGIEPRTDVFGMVIAEEGAPGIIGFRTPESYTDPVLELQ